MQRKRSQTYLLREPRQWEAPGRQPKTSPPGEGGPHTGGTSSQGRSFNPKHPQGQCKPDVIFKETQSPAVRSSFKEISNLTWHFLRKTLRFPVLLLPTTESLPFPLLPTKPSPPAVYFFNQLHLFPPLPTTQVPLPQNKASASPGSC